MPSVFLCGAFRPANGDLMQEDECLAAQHVDSSVISARDHRLARPVQIHASMRSLESPSGQCPSPGHSPPFLLIDFRFNFRVVLDTG